MGLIGAWTYQPCRRLAYERYTVESPKTDTPRSGQPPTTENFVARIEFAMHINYYLSSLRKADNSEFRTTDWKLVPNGVS